jgi:putrescine aminotransferase
MFNDLIRGDCLMGISNKGTAYWQQIDSGHHLHPFTDSKELKAKGPRIVTKADGIYLWDSEGKRTIDGMAGLWCVNVGYGRNELVEAAKVQMAELPYYNSFFQSSTVPTAELSKKLAEITPTGLNHAFFANSGSEANDTIVRMVRRYWDLLGQPERTVIISRDNAYHGSTMAAASLGGMQFMHEQGGLPIPGIEHIMQPYWYHLGREMSPNEFGVKAAQALEVRIQQIGADKVAAFIGEPIQGAGGVIVPPDSYWPEIQRICEEYGILLIADEVICGFGRTGNWFGSETYGIKPDLMAMAKGLSSGYQPISAVMVHDRVADILVQKCGEFAHGFTYSGHPVAAAVALANLDILEREKIVERVGNEIGPYFQERLRELADHPLVGEVRGVGLVAAVELVKDKKTGTLFDSEGDTGVICRDHAFDQGMVIRATGDSIIFSPPLILTKQQIDEMIEIMISALDLTIKDIGQKTAGA